MNTERKRGQSIHPKASNPGHIAVILVSTRNPLNIGAAARAMSNFNVRDLRVVNPYEVAFREAKSAVGAAAIMRNAREYKSVEDAIADCSLVVGTTAARNRKLDIELRTLRDGATAIRKARRSGNVALLFGSEKRGLSNRDFSYCHWLLRIPTREDHAAMNLGQAVAVCLYELARDAVPSAKSEKSAATGKDVERLTTILLRSLENSGYLKGRGESQEEKVRRFVHRLQLSAEDMQLLTGMLRQMLWRVSSQDALVIAGKKRELRSELHQRDHGC